MFFILEARHSNHHLLTDVLYLCAVSLTQIRRYNLTVAINPYPTNVENRVSS